MSLSPSSTHDDHMEQIVKVCHVMEDGTAQVVKMRESACSGDCHKCAGCGAAREMLVLNAKNPIGAKPGDKVVLRSDSAPVLQAAAILYILPLILFLAGYLLGEAFWGKGMVLGLCALALSLIPVRWANRYLTKKMVYTITAFAGDRSC